MKNHISILLLILFCIGCKDDEPAPEIVGSWQLIEVLADPGDGSGQFKRVTSEKRITFINDGTFTSRGLICDFSIDAEGFYDGTFTSTDTGYQISCAESLPLPLALSIDDGFLLVSFPCIEPCVQKFSREN